MYVLEIIERAKQRANIDSDYALAKALNIDRRVVSDWKKGKRHPNNAEAVQLATLAGIDELRVIAEIEAETANTPEKRKFWQHYIEGRGITAGVCMAALAVGFALSPTPANAVLHIADSGAQDCNFNQSKIYIMRNRKVSKRLIWRALFVKWLEFINPYYLTNNYKPIFI